MRALSTEEHMRLARLAVLAALVLGARAAHADNIVISHSGFLRNEADAPVTNSSLAATFRLFDQSAHVESETKLWEGSCNLIVTGGFYAVLLGSGCGADLDSSKLPTDAGRWLEVEVGGQVMTPRLQIGTAPTAATARNAEKLGGLPAANYLKTSDALDADTLAGSTPALLDAHYDARYDARYAKLQTGTTAAQTGALHLSGAVKAGSFEGDGAGLTNLDASELTGTIPDGKLASGSDLAKLSGAQSFSGAKTFTARTDFGSGADLVVINNGGISTTGAIAGGGAISAQGSLSATGNVSAGALFVGDGSSLTGVAKTGSANTFSGTQTIGSGGNTTTIAGGALTSTGTITGNLGIFTTGLTIANNTAVCGTTLAGAIRYRAPFFEGCDGRNWVPLGSQASGVYSKGLALYLDAGNPQSYPGSGTVWKDLSGNGIDLAANEVSWNPSGYFTIDTVAREFASTRAFYTPVGNYSIEWVVQLPNYAAGICPFHHGTTNVNPRTHWHICFRNAGKIEFDEYSNALIGNNVLTNGTEYHLAYVHENNNNFSLYINGVLDRNAAPAAPGTYTGGNQTLALTQLGASSRLRQVRIYTVALTAAQVQANCRAAWSGCP
jgi:hypothetical protein